MKNLIKTEWFKIKKYRAFWWIFGVTALSYPGMSYIFKNFYTHLGDRKGQGAKAIKFLLGDPFSFPEVWHTLAFSSSLLIFVPAVVVIMFITNEYTYKTNRQNIIDGWSRNQFMMSKLINVLILTLIIALLYSVTCFIIGITNDAGSTNDKWSLIYYAGLFALQTFSQLSIAFLIGLLVRKAFISLGIFLFYFLILENIMVGLSNRYLNDIGEFLPFEISDRLIPPPAFWGRIDTDSYQKALSQMNPHILYTFILTTLIWLICFRINSKRDL